MASAIGNATSLPRCSAPIKASTARIKTPADSGPSRTTSVRTTGLVESLARRAVCAEAVRADLLTIDPYSGRNAPVEWGAMNDHRRYPADFALLRRLLRACHCPKRWPQTPGRNFGSDSAEPRRPKIPIARRARLSTFTELGGTLAVAISQPAKAV